MHRMQGTIFANVVLTHAYRYYTKYTGLASIWLLFGIPYGLKSSLL